MHRVGSFCGDELLPEDTYMGLTASLDGKPEAPVDGQALFFISRHPLHTRHLSLKPDDNKHVARLPLFCMSPVAENCAIDSRRGLSHGRQLAQNVIDLDYRARMDAFDFAGGRQYVKLIHINSIGMVGACLY